MRPAPSRLPTTSSGSTVFFFGAQFLLLMKSLGCDSEQRKAAALRNREPSWDGLHPTASIMERYVPAPKHHHNKLFEEMIEESRQHAVS